MYYKLRWSCISKSLFIWDLLEKKAHNKKFYYGKTEIY